MRHAALFAALALAGCPTDPSSNPPRFWIAPNGSELRLRLTAIEPNPF